MRLSQANASGGSSLIRVACPYCKLTRHYFPADLIQIFGDIEIDDIMRRTNCEKCQSRIDAKLIWPSGKEAVGIKIRRLVAIKIRRVPVWRED